MQKRAFWISAALVLSGCGRTADVGTSDKARTDPSKTIPAPQPRAATVQETAPPEDAGSRSSEPPGSSDEPILERLASAPITGAQVVSKRSLSLKLSLGGGARAVFKPIRKGDDRAVNEVAVYRLARLLGVPGVPPSTLRRVPLGLLLRLLRPGNRETAEDLRRTALTDDRGHLPGAIIHWVEDLDPDGFEKAGGFQAIFGPLFAASPSRSGIALNREAAAEVAFDYLTGNWDRFSGGNLFVSTGGDRLVLIDNHGALGACSGQKKERLDQLLARTRRFPRALVSRIAALEKEAVAAALRGDGSAPVELAQDKIDLLFDRRDRLMRHIGALARENGEAEVLAYP